MKTLAKAAIFFEGIIFDKCNSGEKKIPPPIPTRPERNPRGTLTHDHKKIPNLVCIISENSVISFCLKISNIPENSSDVPNIKRKTSLPITVLPPNQEKGAETAIKGRTTRQGIRPFFWYRMTPPVTTIKLQIKVILGINW